MHKLIDKNDPEKVHGTFNTIKELREFANSIGVSRPIHRDLETDFATFEIETFVDKRERYSKRKPVNPKKQTQIPERKKQKEKEEAHIKALSKWMRK